MVWLKYLKLDKELPDLKYAHKQDACFDFVSAVDTVVYPNKTIPTKVPTGMKFVVPEGYELQVRSRSGLATKGVVVFNQPGTVDCGYNGEVQILLVNYGDSEFKIKKGDRIAQGKVALKPYIILQQVDELPNTERGENGFGSSGI